MQSRGVYFAKNISTTAWGLEAQFLSFSWKGSGSCREAGATCYLCCCYESLGSPVYGQRILCPGLPALVQSRGTTHSSVTCRGPIVCNVGSQVDPFVVDVQVSHAPHKVPVGHWEVLRQIGDPSEEQGPCEVEGPVRRGL